MEDKKLVEVELVEKAANRETADSKCNNGCQRDSGAPTGG